jgi:hypothetical protein
MTPDDLPPDEVVAWGLEFESLAQDAGPLIREGVLPENWGCTCGVKYWPCEVHPKKET